MGLLASLFGVSDEQERSDSLDQQLAQVEADYQRRHADDFTDEELATRQGIFAAHQETGRVNVDAELNDAFLEGLDDGARNIRNGIGDTIKRILSTFFKLLPWWLWLAIAAGAFVWFGGLRLIPKPRTA